MLKRIYLDNYKCFTAFTIEFGQLNLLLGKNGTGKSSVLDVLIKLQQLVIERGQVAELFSPSTITKWDKRSKQEIKIVFSSDYGDLEYELEVEHDLSRPGKARIAKENLSCNQRPLFRFEKGDATLYRDNHSEGPVFPSDWNYSVLATIDARPDNRTLSHFKACLAGMRIIREMNPYVISGETSEDESVASGEPLNISQTSGNFARWYVELSLSAPITIQKIYKHLAQVLHGFTSLPINKSGLRTRSISAVFRYGESADEVSYELDKLSEGQRALIFLYAMLATGRDGITALDEPENYVAMQEIQPFILEILDAIEEEHGGQWIIISHHPEYYDLLGEEYGIWFERTANGAIRLGESPKASGDLLTVSEIVARERN